MSYSVKTTKEGIDYNAVSKVLKSFGMSDCDVDTQKKIFQNSYAVSFYMMMIIDWVCKSTFGWFCKLHCIILLWLKNIMDKGLDVY